MATKKKTFWEWLDGKKTVIGVLASAVVTYLSMSGYIDANMTTLLGTISGLIFAGGIGHKIQKAKAKND